MQPKIEGLWKVLVDGSASVLCNHQGILRILSYNLAELLILTVRFPSTYRLQCIGFIETVDTDNVNPRLDLLSY
jgi:hypothetical protein